MKWRVQVRKSETYRRSAHGMAWEALNPMPMLPYIAFNLRIDEASGNWEGQM